MRADVIGDVVGDVAGEAREDRFVAGEDCGCWQRSAASEMLRGDLLSMLPDGDE